MGTSHGVGEKRVGEVEQSHWVSARPNVGPFYGGPRLHTSRRTFGKVRTSVKNYEVIKTLILWTRLSSLLSEVETGSVGPLRRDPLLYLGRRTWLRTSDREIFTKVVTERPPVYCRGQKEIIRLYAP